MSYTKADVERNGHNGTPCVNVKLYLTRAVCPPNADVIAAHFKCAEAVAAKALDFWYEHATEQFWEQAGELAEQVFGTHVAVHSAGRSGGWLCVAGLPDIESWDAVALSKWRHFERLLHRDIAYRCQLRTVTDEIEANRWAEPGAEQYNFATLEDGTNLCLVDVKREVRETVRGGELVIREVQHA